MMLSAEEQEIAKGTISTHREENDCLVVTIPKESFKQGYVVDVQEVINPRSSKEPIRSTSATTRRRLPEYDLNDPFIDDSEIMAIGGVMQDYLLGGGEDQMLDEPTPGEGYVKARKDFMVWRGRLPEPQEDPLWAEQVKPASSTSRTTRKITSTKKKSTTTTATTTSFKKGGGGSTGKKRKGDSQGSKQEEESPQKRAEGKITSKKKKTKTVAERINELGDSEGGSEELSVVVDVVGDDSQEQSKQEEKEQKKTHEEKKEAHEEKINKEDTGKEKAAKQDPVKQKTRQNESKHEEDTLELDDEPAKNNQSIIPSTPVRDQPSPTPQQQQLQQQPSSSEKVSPSANAPPPEGFRKKFDYATPLAELEVRLAMEELRTEAARTNYADPKKLPSSLRPYVAGLLVAIIRRNAVLHRKLMPFEKALFEELATFLPYSPAALEKLTYGRLLDFQRDELYRRRIPALMDEITNAASDLMESRKMTGKKGSGFNERLRSLVFEAVRTELDSQAIGLLNLLHRDNMSPMPFSDSFIRKSFYLKVQSCLPHGMMSTLVIGREYAAAKRKYEIRKLKEHGIEVQPTLVPITSKKDKNGDDDDDEEDNRMVEIDLTEGVVDKTETHLIPKEPSEIDDTNTNHDNNDDDNNNNYKNNDDGNENKKDEPSKSFLQTALNE